MSVPYNSRVTLALALLAALQDSTDAFREWKPVAGHKSILKSEEQSSTWVKFSRGEAARPIKTERAHAFEAAQEILEAEGRVPTLVRRVYSKATYRKNLWEKPFDFQGAAIRFQFDPDGARELSREDKRLITAEDTMTLRGSFFDATLDRGGRNAGENPFWPKSPLKVGDSVDLAVEESARALGGAEFRDWIDPKSSTIKMTYTGAATQAGARYASFDITGRFFLRRFGEQELETPILSTIRHLLEICVDGSRPDSSFSVVVEMKGSSTTPLPGGLRGSLEIDIRRDMKFSARTITEE